MSGNNGSGTGNNGQSPSFNNPAMPLSSTGAPSTTFTSVNASNANISGQSSSATGPPQAAVVVSHQLPPLRPNPTRALTELHVLPAHRTPVLRPGRGITYNKSQNAEAEIGQYVGQLAGRPCTHCAGGSGCWTECVVVAGFFRGSCCNCHYASEGSRCSFRKWFTVILHYKVNY